MGHMADFQYETYNSGVMKKKLCNGAMCGIDIKMCKVIKSFTGQ